MESPLIVLGTFDGNSLVSEKASCVQLVTLRVGSHNQDAVYGVFIVAFYPFPPSHILVYATDSTTVEDIADLNVDGFDGNAFHVILPGV